MLIDYVGTRRVLDDEEKEFHGLDVRRPFREVVSFSQETFGGILVEDDDGAALCWNDFVANNWVELFSTTPVAFMRLALLLDAGEREAWFVHSDALDFHKPAFAFLHENAVQPGSSVVQ